MKKLLAAALSIFSVLSCFPSCDILTKLSQNNSSCEHTYEWVTSENGHQKVYTCGCHTPDILEMHLDADEDCICDICGYEMEKPASQGLEFIKNNDGKKYAVKSIGGCTDKDIVIPNTYEGLPVVAVYFEAFAQNKEVKSVVLPDGLEYIYSHAFNGCSSLKEIVIPDSVTWIESWAFANCTSLQSISFSDNITVVEESTCYGCTALTSIDFGSGVTRVLPDAFYGCIALERLYIPKNVVELTRAFSSCGALNYVEFEIKSGWKWQSSAFFNSKDVTNPERNADCMTGVWNGSSWRREVENE